MGDAVIFGLVCLSVDLLWSGLAGVNDVNVLMMVHLGLALK